MKLDTTVAFVNGFSERYGVLLSTLITRYSEYIRRLTCLPLVSPNPSPGFPFPLAISCKRRVHKTGEISSLKPN